MELVVGFLLSVGPWFLLLFFGLLLIGAALKENDLEEEIARLKCSVDRWHGSYEGLLKEHNRLSAEHKLEKEAAALKLQAWEDADDAVVGKVYDLLRALNRGDPVQVNWNPEADECEEGSEK